MKSLVTVLLAFVPSFAFASAATVVTLDTPSLHVYAPKGFDSNDNSQVFIGGDLPNLCYKSPFTETEIQGSTIRLTAKALFSEDGICAAVQVPFLDTVNFGNLDPGVYELILNSGTAHEKRATIEIKRARSPSIDEHIYANLDTIVKFDQNRDIELRGYNPSDCFVFDRVEFVSNGSDTYSILPIMKKVLAHCPMKMVPFTIRTQVPTGLPEAKILLHVRTMNGKSVNAVYRNRSESR